MIYERGFCDMSQTYYTLPADSFGLTPQTNFQIVHYQQNDIESHTHTFFELVYILNGSAIHEHDDTTEVISAGDYFIIDIGSIHSYKAGENFSLYNFLFLPEFIDETLSTCTSFQELIRHGMYRYHKISLGLHTEHRLFHDTDGRVLQIMNLIYQEYQEQKLGYADICQSLIREIFIRMMRDTLEKEPYHQQISQQYPLPVQQSLHFFSEHFQESATITNFCKEYHYSREYICRLFKKQIGIAPIDYIRKLKMERACLLLSSSDLRINEVAEQCGYHDEKTFRSTFKKLLGITPTEYQKK